MTDGQNYDYWQGAYVFDISLDQGIVLKGTIEHPVSNIQPSGGVMMPMIPAPAPQQYGDIQRILYINNVLYTVSDTMVKLNDLNSLAELKALNL